MGVGFWPDLSKDARRRRAREKKDPNPVVGGPHHLYPDPAVGGLYHRLYPNLAGRRGVKVLARREFSIPSGLWGVLAADGQGPRGREFSDVAGGPAVRRAGFFPAIGIFVARGFFF
jgi:hypothetical protein